jgi:hypothetical protein
MVARVIVCSSEIHEDRVAASQRAAITLQSVGTISWQTQLEK